MSGAPENKTARSGRTALRPAAAIAVSTVFWLSAWVKLEPEMPFYSAFDMLSFRVFACALAVSLVIGLFLSRRPAVALSLGGLVISVCSLAFAYLFGFDAMVYLTEGEAAYFREGNAYVYHAGPLSEPDIEGLGLVEADSGGKGLTVIKEGKKSFVGRRGAKAGGMRLKPVEGGQSPVFVWRTETGEVEAMHIKVRPDGQRDFFLIGYLPYKYVISSGAEGVFRLEAWRGKRLISRESLKKGEVVKTGNVDVTIEEVRKWAGISVRKRPGEGIAALGLAISALGGVLVFRGRRGRSANPEF